MSSYVTTPPRAVLGLVAGTVAGTLLVTLFLVATDLDYFRNYGTQTGTVLIIVIYSAVIWGLGLLLIAPLPWAMLHHYGVRNWPAALVLGAVLTFLTVVVLLTNGFGLVESSGSFSAADNGGPTWIDGRITWHGVMEAMKAALLCSVAGAIVGLVVWRTAYRRELGGSP